MDLRRFQPGRRSLEAFAVGGAWFFIVVSLLHVLWAITVLWGDHSAGTAKLYHTVVGDVSYDALWLTYTGGVGLVFAIMQLLIVSAAAVISTLRFDRTVKARRAAHLVLGGWSALWALNLVRLAAIDGRIDTIAQATLLSVLFACTAWRAALGWTPPRSSTPTADPPAGVPTLGPAAEPASVDADRESFSARVAVALNGLVRFGRAARRRTARGLHRVADFAHRQASRLAPNTGE